MDRQVGNRIIKKRINVRVEHVRQSKCRQDFLDRVKRNEDIKRQAKESGSTWGCLRVSLYGRGGV
jgi:large subunit ribosomal protein L21e